MSSAHVCGLLVATQAVPDCSSLEAQMFMAMVDVNGDNRLSLQVHRVQSKSVNVGQVKVWGDVRCG